MPLRSRIERLERERGTARVPEEPSPATERLLTRLNHYRAGLDFEERKARARDPAGDHLDVGEPPEPLPPPTPEERIEDLENAGWFQHYLEGQVDRAKPGTATREVVERLIEMNAEKIERLQLEIDSEAERSDR